MCLGLGAGGFGRNAGSRRSPSPKQALRAIVLAVGCLAATSSIAASPGVAAVCPRASDLEIPLSARGELVGVGGYGGYDRTPRDVSRAINANVAYGLANGETVMLSSALRELAALAAADAWRPTGFAPAASWGVVEALASLLPAWTRLRETQVVNATTRRAVDAWVRRRHEDARVLSPNNQTLLRAANAAHLASIDGPARMEEAKEAVRGYLGHSAPDGSLPFEAVRGRLALVYTARALSSIALIADLDARAKGEFWAEIGPQFDHAVDFLLAADREPSLIDRHAIANRHPSPDLAKFRPASQKDPFEGGLRAWVLFYAAAHPGSARTAALVARAAPTGRRVQDAAGGWASCWTVLDVGRRSDRTG